MRRHRRNRMGFAVMVALVAGLLAAFLHPDPRDRTLAERVTQFAERTAEYLRPPV